MTLLEIVLLQQEPTLEGDYHDQAQNHRDWRDREDGQRRR